ncbi:DprA-like winged helix domain-containing protein [Actinomadura sediminis]|uniref:DprA winged helix domain-containing protein n=1 Tax=Actinomadura sediminis TaxID=1038904 RepID=A0ABW3F1V8_9ACTN
MSELFESLLRPYDERRRAELVAAYTAVEHAAEPVPEVRFPALREPALRRTVEGMLALSGRTLVRSDRTKWISGYRDDVAAELARDPECVPPVRDRAVLTLVLIHSVAIPRAAGRLGDDSWLSPFPTPVDELRRRTQLPVGELDAALRRLRLAGLVSQVKAGSDDTGGFVPGPQFHRLTPAARRRLQEELILAAGPDSPLAAAIRARRRNRESDQGENT